MVVAWALVITGPQLWETGSGLPFSEKGPSRCSQSPAAFACSEYLYTGQEEGRKGAWVGGWVGGCWTQNP